MEKITTGHPLSMSEDIAKQNLETLKALFPTIVKEGKLDVEELKALLGEEVENSEEFYRFTWAGKSQARQEANKPSTGTLRPVKEESKDWDTTQNIFIEGDNLEVLKLLQKSYAGKVKVIYIDPPYNTGKDFVYKDNYTDNLDNYLNLTGQTDEDGKRLSTNTESDGRYHSNWLNMLYPRLRLARNLLKDDGVAFISINDIEVHNLKKLCDEIFGEENFIGQITWKARVKPVNIGDAKYRPQREVEYVLTYQKKFVSGVFQPLLTGGVRSYPYLLEGRKYRTATILKSNRGVNYRSTMSFELDGYVPPEGQRWQAGDDVIKQLYNDGYIEFKEGTPFRRYFEDEEGAEHDPFYCFMETEWSSTSEAGKHELNEILGNNHDFDTVKPVRLITTLLQAVTNASNNDIIFDFFAGSGTTGQAVMYLNSTDNGNRRFICVQFPEPIEPGTGAYKLGFKSISEISKERLRRAGEKIKSEIQENLFTTTVKNILDVGLRVYKLDTSNVNAWDGSVQNFEQTLLTAAENIKPERTEEDVLYEILLKSGLDLTQPIEEKSIAGKRVFNIGGGALFICLANDLTTAIAEAIGNWKQELQPATCRVIFRDTGFTDVEKTNSIQILKRYGIGEINTI